MQTTQQPQKQPAPPWLIPVVVLAIVAVVAAAMALGFAIDRDGHHPMMGTAAAGGSIESGCQAWADSTGDADGADGWCPDLSSWMTSHLGRGMMSGAWDDPGDLRDACLGWLRDGSADVPRAQDLCREMSTWMGDHHMMGGDGR